MEDRRIRKTRKLFHQTLTEMLADYPFEKITVKELCERADTSRITFYTHYNDKFDLADEMFDEMLNAAQLAFGEMEKSHNPDSDPIITYGHYLTSVLNLYEREFAFFRHTTQRENPYLYYSFYRRVFERVETQIAQSSPRLIPKYPLRKTTVFLCDGLWGFINACIEEGCPFNQIRQESQALLMSILRSDVLTSRKKDKNN